MQLFKKNVVLFDLEKNLDFVNARNNFVLNKLKFIFFNWNIKFFKSIMLRKNKLTYYNVDYKYYLFFFKNLESLNIFFKKNFDKFEQNLKIKNIIFDGFSLNYNLMKKWKFNNIILNNIWLNLFIKQILELIIFFLFGLILKIFFFFKFNFLIIKKNV